MAVSFGAVTEDFSITPRPPRTPGVYVFLDVADRIMYAGMAHDLEAVLYRYKGLKGRQAMRDRRAEGTFDRVAWLGCRSPEVVPSLERVMISRFRPPWNGQYNYTPRSDSNAMVFDESQQDWLVEAESRLDSAVHDLLSDQRLT